MTPFTFLLLSTTMRLGVLSLLPGPSFLLNGSTTPYHMGFLVRPTALSAMSLLVAPAAFEPKGLAAGLPLAVAAPAALEPKWLAAGRDSMSLAVARL